MRSPYFLGAIFEMSHFRELPPYAEATFSERTWGSRTLIPSSNLGGGGVNWEREIPQRRHLPLLDHSVHLGLAFGPALETGFPQEALKHDRVYDAPDPGLRPRDVWGLISDEDVLTIPGFNFRHVPY